MFLSNNSPNLNSQPELINSQTEALKRSIKNHEEHSGFWGAIKDVATAITIGCALAMAAFIAVVALIRKAHEGELPYSTFKKTMFGITGIISFFSLMTAAVLIGAGCGLWYNWVKRPELKHQCQAELASINASPSFAPPPAYGAYPGTGDNPPPPYVANAGISTTLYPKLR